MAKPLDPMPEDDTTPIVTPMAERLFDPNEEGLQCPRCMSYLVWTATKRVWWCVNPLCKWYRKAPTKP